MVIILYLVWSRQVLQEPRLCQLCSKLFGIPRDRQCHCKHPCPCTDLACVPSMAHQIRSYILPYLPFDDLSDTGYGFLSELAACPAPRLAAAGTRRRLLPSLPIRCLDESDAQGR